MVVNVEIISPREVKAALENMRQSRSLQASHLLATGALEDRQRRAAGAHRAWLLRKLLVEVIAAQLARHRSWKCQLCPDDGLAADERQLLRQDFEQHNAEHESWSVLYYRYVATLGLGVQDIVAITGTSDRTIRRRMHHGYELVAQRLRDMDQAASG